MKRSYHTQHAPLGAFASFTLGLHGAGGGFGQSREGPAAQKVYVGYRYPGEDWTLLPFFGDRGTGAGDIDAGVETAAPAGAAGVQTLPDGRYGRSLTWATDRWMAQALTFSITSPFDRIEDLETLDDDRSRLLLAPALYAVLEYENSHSDEPVELVFGLGDPAQPWRFLGDADERLCGFACGNAYGYATRPGEQVRALQAGDLFAPSHRDERGQHGLGREHGLIFTIPAGGRAAFPIVLGFYDSARATSVVRTHFHYTHYYDSLRDMLVSALGQFDDAVAIARSRDAEFRAFPLSADQKFILAQAVHSYRGSTQLLVREDGRPLWVVNEGEYRMMNTLDLTVDHLFFELQWHPWAVRDTLDLFVERYAYRDHLRLPEGGTAPGGISFAHDMGVAGQFSRPGHSSYECEGLTGCFSHMTMEQLLNWVCCAVTYAVRTGDQAWLEARRDTLLECSESLLHRDHPQPDKRDGLLKCDSDRCGPDGAEITTYDSLDASLGQARNNLYVAIKSLGAWLLLEHAFTRLDLDAAAREAGAAVERVAAAVCARFDVSVGMFPAVFEGGNASRILSVVEGLVYPLYIGLDAALARSGRLGRLLDLVEQHVRTALVRGVCLDATSGGWKLSSTSRNTWMSKIAIAQHVVRRLFPAAMTPEAAAADAVHAGWLAGPGCARHAMCDQILSDDGRAIGSRFYPRGVTAFLWLYE